MGVTIVDTMAVERTKSIAFVAPNKLVMQYHHGIRRKNKSEDSELLFLHVLPKDSRHPKIMGLNLI
jgi:hypothetical protein